MPEVLKHEAAGEKKAPETVFQMKWFNPANDTPVDSALVTDYWIQD